MKIGILYTSHPDPATEAYPHHAVHARTTREVRALVSGDKADIAREAAEPFGARAIFGLAVDGPLTLVCPTKNAAPLADWLVARGAEHVAVATNDYIFGARNALYEKLVARIG